MRFLASALALVTLIGCSGEDEAKQTAAKEAVDVKPLVSGIDYSGMDKSVRPGDDFFAYMNGAWYDSTEIPADRSSVGAFQVLSDESQENVLAIIEESAAGDFATGTDEQKVGDLYKSYTDMETRNAKGVAPLQPQLDRIDQISNYDELAVYFATSGKRGYDAPFALGQNEDFKDPNRYMMYTWQGGLGLPDREYYFKDDEKSVETRDKYVAHIARMFDLAGWEDGEAAAATIMALETRMAEQHMLKEDARDFAKNYQKFPLDELGTLMPNFNWTGYLENSGISDIDGLVVLMQDHMKALDGIIQDTDLDTWKTYLRWVALNDTASRLTADLDQANFDFYGKVLTGQEEQRPMWRRGVRTVNQHLGEVVGKVYVKRHFPPEAKQKMLELVNNLIVAYDQSIKELDWMTDATREQALDKLHKFTPKIGYPDKWRDYSRLEIKGDDLFGNIERASLAEHERAIERRNKEVDRSEWHMNPQTVNAYYNPPLNEIVFPAAILQPPFFNLEADDAVNYGAIGAVIGHEIGHGFDDKGSTFDGDGVLRNWWTDEDRSEFESRTSKLVGQYNEFKPFEDLSVNGEFTLGENIGDLGGASIGLLAYQLSLEGEQAPVIDELTGTQRVLLGYAQVWRSKMRDEIVRQRIQTDPHSPPIYRVNGVVRNVPEFYEAFDVAEGDALYLPPEERVKIW